MPVALMEMIVDEQIGSEHWGAAKAKMDALVRGG